MGTSTITTRQPVNRPVLMDLEKPEAPFSGKHGLLPSLTDFAFLAPIAFLFIRMSGTRDFLGDGDTGWHLRTGEWILNHGQVPHQDMFSFTMPGRPWFAWEWLWDAGFAVIHQHVGMAGVVLASVFLLALTFAFLFRLADRKCGNALIAFAVTILATSASSIHWLARPHLFTLFFTTLFYTLLERVKEGKTWYLRLLPLLTILWVNLHGGFFVGMVLIGAYAGGEAITWFTGSGCVRDAAKAEFRRYALTLMGCLAASFVNPYTWHLHQHVFAYLSDSFLFDHISEFRSLNFQHPAARYFEILLVLGVGAIITNFRARRYGYVLLLGAWLHMALFSGRNIPIFAIVAAPLVAEMLQDLLVAAANRVDGSKLAAFAAHLVSRGRYFSRGERIRRVPLASCAGFVLLTAALFAPAPRPAFRAEYDAQRFPAKAAGFVHRSGAERVFTSDVWGGYLIYKLYPHAKVYFDGRSDFYGSKFLKQYIDIVNVAPKWEDSLVKYGIDLVLLPTDYPLAGAMKESHNWRTVYDDGSAIVFEPVGKTATQVSSLRDYRGGKRSPDTAQTLDSPAAQEDSDRAIVKPQPTI